MADAFPKEIGYGQLSGTHFRYDSRCILVEFQLLKVASRGKRRSTCVAPSTDRLVLPQLCPTSLRADAQWRLQPRLAGARASKLGPLKLLSHHELLVKFCLESRSQVSLSNTRAAITTVTLAAFTSLRQLSFRSLPYLTIRFPLRHNWTRLLK